MSTEEKNDGNKKTGGRIRNLICHPITIMFAVFVVLIALGSLLTRLPAPTYMVDASATTEVAAPGTATTTQQVSRPQTLGELEARLRNHDRTITNIHVYVADNEVLVSLADGTSTQIGIATPKQIDELTDVARQSGMEPTFSQSDGAHTFSGYVVGYLPLILLAVVGIVVFKHLPGQGKAGARTGFGKSTARLLTQTTGVVTFKDVAGIDEARGELEEIVEFLKDPQKFQRLGGKIPKGVLLVGPPGTGKTLLARSIAGEAKVPFFTISGSDFVEMFVGVGASRVRDMFAQGKQNAPCIIFIDEIDAVGRHRGAGHGGGNDEREQTLNQLLVEMDGFEANEGVILIAATNRPDVLDPALLRPGRFDRQVVVSNPDVNGRDQILAVHMSKVPLAADVDRMVLARGTPGFSGADLANLVNEAALLAAREDRRSVAMRHFEAAKDKVMMGSERKSLVMDPAEKRMTAFHEGGHALCGVLEEECDPVHKATVIPRGRALGLVLSLPKGDSYSKSKSKLLAELVMMMGGRAAEEIIFGADKVSNGAAQDIKVATDQARRMITEWGMSEKLGLVCLAQTQDSYLHSSSQRSIVSEETARAIDAEVKAMMDTAYGAAKNHLTQNKAALDRLAAALLEYETLSGDEVRDVIANRAIRLTTTTDSVPSTPRPAWLPPEAEAADAIYVEPTAMARVLSVSHGAHPDIPDGNHGG